MATRIDLPKEMLKQTINAAIASAQRGINTARNPAFKLLFEKELTQLRAAFDTIEDIK